MIPILPILLLIFNGVFGEFPEVKTNLGNIQGTWKKSPSGRKYAAFEGVPYAEPSTNNRFRPAELVKPWRGKWIANTTFVCLQVDHFTRKDEYEVVGDEDCLYLNIYVPETTKNKKLDVIVYIHGGAFMFGSGNFYQPELLMNKDVVYVNLNYRLGILGFLSTEDNVIPGNNGLKDQLLALKWIQKHISAFGGNPNSVTLTGMSAGAASAHILYLSPLSEGLIHKGFSQSGTSLNPWVLVENSLEKAKRLANYLGCPSKSSRDILSCLRERPGRQIVQSTNKFFHWLYNPFSPFGVVVDKWADMPILPQHPLEILMKGKLKNIPWIFSLTESEGLYPAAEFLSHPSFLEELNQNWETTFPHILDLNHTVAAKDLNSVIKKIHEFYFKDKFVSKETFPHLVKMMGDRLFAVDVEKAAKIQASKSTSQIYFYYFTYRGTHSASEMTSGKTENFGASHADDTLYVVSNFMQRNCTNEDRKMSEIMTNIWSTFAIYGKPVIEGVTWTPVSKEKNDPLRFLKIAASTNLEMETNENLGNMLFWDSLPCHENFKLFAEKDEL